jgi:gluconolactonase
MLTVLTLLWLASGQAPLAEGPVEVVAEGLQFTEGPVVLPSGELIFSDIPADTIYRADKSVFRRPSGKSNGLALDPQGRLIACEHANRRLTRTEKDGTVAVLVDRYDGKRLNSPNDLAVRADGAIFFTDPPYGLEGAPAELPFSGVYCLLPDGTLKLLEKDFDRPNGIALGPKGKTLYVADTAANLIRAFRVDSKGDIDRGRVLCTVPSPDGLKVDEHGRIWCAAGGGVRVFSPAGKPLGVVETPQEPANCGFGENVLYITARTAVYKVRCK